MIKKVVSDKSSSQNTPLFNQDDFCIELDNETSTFHVASFSRSQERNNLQKLIEKMFQSKNNEDKEGKKIKSRKDIFD